ncbi:hypothetical protein ACFWDQ_42570, partial [Streptomyces sp. NPDC060053]
MSKPQRQRPSGTSPLGRPALAAHVEPLNVGDSRTPEVRESGSTGVPESGSLVPRYLTLVRTEARIRDDQAAELTALRRRVSAGRRSKVERITDNTLMRVAIDLLLAHAERLSGDT